jgi:transposase
MTTHVKRAFKYRFYPTDGQAAELARTFGCVRKVYVRRGKSHSNSEASIVEMESPGLWPISGRQPRVRSGQPEGAKPW